MQKYNINLIIALTLLSSCAMASSNTSSAISAPITDSKPPQITGINPFSAGEQSLLSITVPSLIIQEKALLSQEVKKWVEKNGYKLYWNSKKDYLVYNNITLSGKTDDEILQSLGELFFSENYGLVVKKYQKNRVIVIDDM